MTPHLCLCLLTTLASIGLTSVRASACDRLNRTNIVACVLAQSLDTRAEREGLSAAEGRETAAGTVLPSNPSLALSGGVPVGYPVASNSLTWAVSLAQELEVGGQRGHRRNAARAQRSAQARRVDARAREIARAALLAYFDALAAREEGRLAQRLAVIAQALGTYAQSRSEVGLMAPVESVVAQAEALRLSRLGLEAELRLRESLARLTAALGRDPSRVSVEVEGSLEPLHVPDVPLEAMVRLATSERADVQVAAAEAKAANERGALARSQRVPNPTFSVFFRKDWIGERVAGIGLALPIPLPAPLGRTFAGEIAESDALSRRSNLEGQQLRQRVRLEVVSAKATSDARAAQLALFTADSVAKAEDGVNALAEALRGQKIAIRDALLTEQALVELLQSYIDARHQSCAASVELAHAAGLAIERGVQ